MMSEAIVDVDDLTIYRTDGVETGGVRESVLLLLKSVKGELIRCKDCIYYDGYGCCDLLSYFSRGEGVDYLEVNENEDFCSKAERKEE